MFVTSKRLYAHPVVFTNLTSEKINIKVSERLQKIIPLNIICNKITNVFSNFINLKMEIVNTKLFTLK